MADENEQTTPPDKPAEASLQEQLEAALAEADKWKGLSRKNEEHAKSNLEKAKQFDELENANKTELQKLQDQLSQVSAEKDSLTTKQLRYEVASKHGLHGSELKLLNGDTEEQLDESAQIILELRGQKPKAPSSEGQGKVGQPIGGNTDQLSRDALHSLTPQQVAAALKEGRLDDLLGKTKKGA